MIIGIGTDLVAIARVEAVYRCHSQRFVQRLLNPAERSAFEASKEPSRWLAKRWAAKEAFSKALGTGIRAPLTLASIVVSNDELGRPQIALTADVLPLLEARAVKRIHLSLSDEREHALAFVICES